ncbi:group I truncated hemoglobin [Paenibacillus qinlingensis]|uniref:group I truncated hemoglobin n=1 Tax=Paenibacillus qinlingensis TaxID=1837343 RepID=UPI001567B024|nr:group 1 truncated hemoglobin [Paenibacillus qinlingensis]NQX62612.1 group 1 truncated hemoglobin [Paenibacillus qinlingensis]
MSEPTLYDKLGGEGAITAVVDYFYELVLADETVNHFFNNTDMEKQRKHQAKFFSFALGGPNQYTGASMAKVHAGMNLQEEHFKAITTHLHDALAHFEVGADKIDQVLAKVSTLKDDILHK